jgi:disulfide bond formation protein DsbB
MSTTQDKGWWTAAAVAATSAAILATVYLAQFGFDLMPCELCYAQRPAYFLTLVFGALALMPAVDSKSRRLVVLHCAGLFALTAGIGAYHAGVEWHWWLGPTACTSTGAKIDFSNLAAALQRPSLVMCDQPAFRFLGLSMAGYNFIAATILAVASAWAATRSTWWVKS